MLTGWPTPATKAFEMQRIMDPDYWPSHVLNVKTVPWLGEQRYGIMHEKVPLTVYVKESSEVLKYDSIEALVDVWMGD